MVTSWGVGCVHGQMNEPMAEDRNAVLVKTSPATDIQFGHMIMEPCTKKVVAIPIPSHPSEMSQFDVYEVPWSIVNGMAIVRGEFVLLGSWCHELVSPQASPHAAQSNLSSHFLKKKRQRHSMNG